VASAAKGDKEGKPTREFREKEREGGSTNGREGTVLGSKTVLQVPLIHDTKGSRCPPLKGKAKGKKGVWQTPGWRATLCKRRGWGGEEPAPPLTQMQGEGCNLNLIKGKEHMLGGEGYGLPFLSAIQVSFAGREKESRGRKEKSRGPLHRPREL